MSTALAIRPCAVAADPPKRWTTAEFDRMLGQGFLVEGSDTYLWEGLIVEPMSEHLPHVHALGNLSDLLRERFPSALWTVNQDAPLELEDGTKPQPDMIVLKGARARFRVHAPRAENVAFLIEVSNSSYPRDSGERLRKYAGMLIPLYWIVNIPARRVEVYENPVESDDGPAFYEKRADFGLGQAVPFRVTHGGAEVAGEIAVNDILQDSMEQPEGEARE
jgi:hypothetical protein